MVTRSALSVTQRVAGCDWEEAQQALDARGYAVTAPLLTPAECEALVELYARRERFRSSIVMARHGFGEGEYRYFADPLPPLVAELRGALYPQLAPIANHWASLLGTAPDFPDTLPAFLERCRAQGQTKPTPLLLRYEAGGFNCLHQDIYGAVAFPFQVLFVLSRRDVDFAGGEFLLVEQRPRAQSRGQVIALDQGQALVFPTRYRPVAGSRGYYRANLRHGVSRLSAGVRYSFGVIFHDAA